MPSENLAIRFDMAAPIALGHRKPLFPLHFDALLMWLKAVSEGGISVLDELPEDYPPIELPLEKSGARLQYYNASAWWLVSPRWGTECWIKSGNLFTWLGIKLKEDKMLEIQNYILTPAVYFFARGNRADVERLLNRQGLALGARTGVGWGRVRKISLSVIPDDLSVWDKSGNPARVIPVDDPETPPEAVERSGVVMARYKPPYWHGPQVPCLVPPLGRWWPGVNSSDLSKLEELAESRSV